MNYRFHNAEKGVMYEIMLPKKIQYQDFLFASLVKGFRTFTFSGYFKQNEESVKQLFEKYSDIIYLKGNILELFDTDYNPIFQGYSMYEVDGVFRHDDSVAFDEELTQIIRIYFIPDYISIAKRFPSYSNLEILKFADTFFSLSTNMYRRMQQFIKTEEDIMNAGISHPQKHNELSDYFNNWVDAVSVFVFGYIIHEICLHLSTYYEEKKIKELEKEIWVTSQWGILINRTKLKV